MHFGSRQGSGISFGTNIHYLDESDGWDITGYEESQLYREQPSLSLYYTSYSSYIAHRVWVLVVESIIGYKEKCKNERGPIPGKGLQALWNALQAKGIVAPYQDPRNGATVLYEQQLDRIHSRYIKDLLWWSYWIGFRVIQSNLTQPFQSIAATLPPEILLLICKHALPAEGERRRDIARISLTCRTWAAKRQQLLFGADVMRSQPVGESDAPSYIALVAQYAREWWLYDDTRESPPGWISRYIALYAAARHRLPASKRHHHEAKIRFEIDFGKFYPARCRSIFPLRPRSLPPSCLSALQRLTLDKYKFRRFSDLVHILWELTGLQHLVCEQVLWDEFDYIQPPTVRNSSHDRLSVDISACPDIGPFVLLLTSVFRVQTDIGSGILDGSDVLKISSLVSLIQHIFKGSPHVSIRREGCVVGAKVTNEIDALEIEFALTNGPEISPHSLRIMHLNVIIPYDFNTMEYNWTELGKHAAPLIRETGGTFMFMFASPIDRQHSEEQYLWNAAYIASRVPSMQALGQLKFQVARTLENVFKYQMDCIQRTKMLTPEHHVSLDLAQLEIANTEVQTTATSSSEITEVQVSLDSNDTPPSLLRLFFPSS